MQLCGREHGGGLHAQGEGESLHGDGVCVRGHVGCEGQVLVQAA